MKEEQVKTRREEEAALVVYCRQLVVPTQALVNFPMSLLQKTPCCLCSSNSLHFKSIPAEITDSSLCAVSNATIAKRSVIWHGRLIQHPFPA